MVNSFFIVLCFTNLFFVVRLQGLKKKVNQLTKENYESQQALSQKISQIKILERRQKIEETNRHHPVDIDDRLHAKGYLSSQS